MSESEERRECVLSIARDRLGGEPDEFAVPMTVLASPSWRGVEADIWVARRADASIVFKHFHHDTGFYVDAAAAIDAARVAGSTGAAPRVVGTWPELRMFAMDHCGEGWRVGGLHDAADSDIRARIVAAKKTLHSGPRFARDADIFADIERLLTFCAECRATLPPSIEAYTEYAAQAARAVQACGVDRVPCHRDGNTSNLMISPEGQVCLLDFDMAANADPFEDLGCCLIEMFECEPEARAGFEEWAGAFDEGLFQRAMVYGILDDLRWALTATAMAATSPRRTLEFAKYASWRYLRFEQNSQRSAGADRLRRLA